MLLRSRSPTSSPCSSVQAQMCFKSQALRAAVPRRASPPMRRQGSIPAARSSRRFEAFSSLRSISYATVGGGDHRLIMLERHANCWRNSSLNRPGDVTRSS